MILWHKRKNNFLISLFLLYNIIYHLWRRRRSIIQIDMYSQLKDLSKKIATWIISNFLQFRTRSINNPPTCRNFLNNSQLILHFNTFHEVLTVFNGERKRNFCQATKYTFSICWKGTFYTRLRSLESRLRRSSYGKLSFCICTMHYPLFNSLQYTPYIFNLIVISILHARSDLLQYMFQFIISFTFYTRLFLQFWKNNLGVRVVSAHQCIDQSLRINIRSHNWYLGAQIRYVYMCNFSLILHRCV